MGWSPAEKEQQLAEHEEEVQQREQQFQDATDALDKCHAAIGRTIGWRLTDDEATAVVHEHPKVTKH